MSQSHVPQSTSQVPKRRIIRHKDDKTVCDFQSGEIFAFGPLYKETKPEGANYRECQSIKSAAQLAWEYFIEQTRLDEDLMNEIRGGQTVLEQIPDDNPNVTEHREGTQTVEEFAESNDSVIEPTQGIQDVTQQTEGEFNVPDENVRELAQGNQIVMGQYSQGNQNDTEEREGEFNAIELPESNTDKDVTELVQASETVMGSNALGEGTEIVAEYMEGNEYAIEQTVGNELGEETVAPAQGNQLTEGNQNDIERDEELIMEFYMSKIGDVIDEAKSAYDDEGRQIIDEMEESCFKRMMINHGCLFLLQMFLFLGLGVGKPETRSELHEILFGSDKRDYENRKSMFSKCMVFPGNQIPLLVLNKLIDHSFFKKVALKEEWEKPSSSDPVRSVVHDLILDPVLKKNQSSISEAQTACTRLLQGFVKKIKICGKQRQLNSMQEQHEVEQITDILHGLHSRLVGTARGDIVEDRPQHDLEVGIDEGQRIPSATKMYSKGIDFKGVSGMAIRDIHMKDGTMMGKVLHLPVFTFNEMMKDTYTSLKGYENEQGLREKEVSAYLRFLCDIVRNDQDAALLEQKGVIKVDDRRVLIDEVVAYLKKVACAASAPKARRCLLPLTSANLRTVKLDIIQYHLKPWYSKYVTSALFLSLFSLLVSIISLTFSILSYFLQRERHHH